MFRLATFFALTVLLTLPSQAQRPGQGERGMRGGSITGTVLDDRLTVACESAALGLVRLQRSGREAMDAAAFLRGHPIPPATVLDRLAPPS